MKLSDWARAHAREHPEGGQPAVARAACTGRSTGERPGRCRPRPGYTVRCIGRRARSCSCASAPRPGRENPGPSPRGSRRRRTLARKGSLDGPGGCIGRRQRVAGEIAVRDTTVSHRMRIKAQTTRQLNADQNVIRKALAAFWFPPANAAHVTPPTFWGDYAISDAPK